ncbi:MAG TPA: hypothetical protein VGM66_05770 [Candidatus Udaeobacter sp.]|jgi:hypothetical protein
MTLICGLLKIRGIKRKKYFGSETHLIAALGSIEYIMHGLAVLFDTSPVGIMGYGPKDR